MLSFYDLIVDLKFIATLPFWSPDSRDNFLDDQPLNFRNLLIWQRRCSFSIYATPKVPYHGL